jgi:hypothetical protein
VRRRPVPKEPNETLRPGDLWRGRIKDNAAQEVSAEARETVVRSLEVLALTQVAHELRMPGAPLVKEVVFEIEEG